MSAAVIGSPRKERLCKNRKGQLGRLRRSDHQQRLFQKATTLKSSCLVISVLIITCLWPNPIIPHTFEPFSTRNWSRKFSNVHNIGNLAFTDGLALGAYLPRHAYSMFGPTTRNHHLALRCGANENLKRDITRYMPLMLSLGSGLFTGFMRYVPSR